jgi:hypothetical protein
VYGGIAKRVPATGFLSSINGAGDRSNGPRIAAEAVQQIGRLLGSGPERLAMC